MSKKTFRKGVALATGLSFGLVGLTAMPATADATGRVTLVPASGSTFNSLTTDGFTFVTEIDDDLSVNDKYLTYKIENPGKKDLRFYSEMDYYYESGPYLSGGNLVNDSETYEAWGAHSVKVLVNGELVNASGSNNYYDDAVLYVQVDDTYADVDTLYDATYSFAGSDNSSVFSIVTNEDSGDVNLKVTAWLNRSESEGDGSIDADETQFATDTEAVNLYDPKNISAKVIFDDSDMEIGEGSVDFDVQLSNDINVGQIDPAQFAAVFYENGSPLDLFNELGREVSTTDSPLNGADAWILSSDTSSNTLTGTFNIVSDRDAPWAAFDDKLIAANYSARVAWIAETDEEDDFWVGSRSSAFAVAEGSNDDVAALVVSADDSKNTISVGGGDFEVRPGTKAVSYTVQALALEADTVGDDELVELEASNVRVRVIVDIDTAVEGTKISVSGSSRTLTSTSDPDLYVYGRTDSNGEFKFTVNSAVALDGEAYDIDVEYLDVDGVWQEDDIDVGDLDGGAYESDITSWTNEIDYVDAYVDTFEFASDILAGSSVKATVSVEDQYGQAISTLDGDALKVFLTDSEDFEKSANVTSGKAEFSFTNWLTKGDTATLAASLYTGSDETDLVDVSTSDNPIEATLYNPEATGAVIVDAEADINITQEAFIVGEEDADADIVAPSENELLYEGIVEDANGAGLPAAVVTIKGAGLQFEDTTAADAEEWFKDSITVVADETGYFAVNVWAHKVGETVITVTSGGKSDTTTLTAAFGALTEDDVKISWNAPKHPAINGLYAVTIKVTDLWGNAIEGADVEINTDGALQVNGDDIKEKTTNASGKATVYVGGVKDLKGFGSVTAVITNVYIDVNGDNVDLDLGNSADGIQSDEIDAEDTLLASGALAEGDYTSVTQEVLVGVSASAAAGKNAGVVIAKAWNTKGKTLQVYVGGKLKATRTTVSGVDTVKVTGIKAGSKLVTIKVGGSTYFSGYVTVK